MDPSLLVPGNFRESGGYDAMRVLLELSDPPTAVFAVNDLAALGALHAIADAGLRAPDDISVVGFDDLFQATYVTPRLTTMQVPHRAMGARAVERLLAMIIDGVWPDATAAARPLVARKALGRPLRGTPRRLRERDAAESGRQADISGHGDGARSCVSKNQAAGGNRSSSDRRCERGGEA